MRTRPNRPTGALAPLQTDLARLFDLRDWPMNLLDEEPMIADWRPAVDVDERDREYIVRADLPGVEPKDIEITLDDGLLTLRGERREEHRETDNGKQRVECFTGSFYRRLTLPDAADSDAVSARFDKGVLEITVPKSEKKKARRIAIQS